MSPLRRRTRPAVMAAAGLAALAVVPVASAAVRYASPSGTAAAATGCLQAAPCSLTQALTSLAASTTVVLASGDYTLPSRVDITAPAVTITGDTSGLRPRIAYTGDGSGGNAALVVFGTGTTLRWLQISGRTDGNALVQFVGGTTAGIEAVDVRNTSTSGWGLATYDATVRDSTIVSAGSFAAVVNGEVSGSTLVCTGSGGTALLVDTNYRPGASTVVRGSLLLGPADGAGLRVAASGGASASATLFGSWSSGNQQIGPGAVMAVGAGNLPASPAPAFVNAAAGDYHQAARSVTVDAAPDDTPTSGRDADGQNRVMGDHPDIGSDERGSGALGAPAASAVTTTGARLTATASPRIFLPTTVTWRYTPVAGGATVSLAAQPVPMPGMDEPVGATLTGLVPGTAYRAQLVMTNAFETVEGATVDFTTAADPVAAAPAPSAPAPTTAPVDRTAPVIASMRLVPTRPRAGRPAALTITTSEAGTASLQVLRRAPRAGAAWRVRGTVTLAATTGTGGTLTVPARLLRAPGPVRLRVTVRDAAGNVSAARTLTTAVAPR